MWRGTFAGSPVAIKICSLTPRHPSDDSRAAIQHFRRETTRYYHLRHPCIVQFFCVVHHNPSNHLLLVTELMKGGSLYHALEKLRRAGAKALPLSALLRTCTHIANGLAYLHASNFSFGDLKSMNVLLSEQPDTKRHTFSPGTQAKLCDFGLSRNLDRLIPMETHVPARNGPAGTYAYLAPEAFSGLPVDDTHAPKAADVYALAIVLWELATLRSPWPQKQPLQLFRLVVKEGQRPTWPSRNTLPAGFIRLVERCWLQDAAKRPTADQVARGLATLLDAFGDTAATPSSPVIRSSAFTRHSVSSLHSKEAMRVAFGADLLSEDVDGLSSDRLDDIDLEQYGGGNGHWQGYDGEPQTGGLESITDDLVDVVVDVDDDDDRLDDAHDFESFAYATMVEGAAEAKQMPTILLAKPLRRDGKLGMLDAIKNMDSTIKDMDGMKDMANVTHMTTSSVESSSAAGSNASSAARLRKYSIPSVACGIDEELQALERESEVGVDSVGVSMFARPHFR